MAMFDCTRSLGGLAVREARSSNSGHSGRDLESTWYAAVERAKQVRACGHHLIAPPVSSPVSTAPLVRST
eukprot:7289886-Prymnesium_polylepis.1